MRRGVSRAPSGRGLGWEEGWVRTQGLRSGLIPEGRWPVVLDDVGAEGGARRDWKIKNRTPRARGGGCGDGRESGGD